MTRLKNILIIAVLLSLTGCNVVKRELGVDRNSPDEFMVVKQAPLTMPPDYTLRPPTTQEEMPLAAAASGTARQAVLGSTSAPVTKGAAETALLDKLGAGLADADIRRRIDEENGILSFNNRTVAEKLIFWDDEKPADNIPSSVVDPAAEAARIKKNQAEGKPITDGAVPVIEKKQNTLESIF